MAKDADKKGKGKGAAAAGSPISVAGHPRMRAAVRRAKGWGALAGFGLVAFASAHAGAVAFDVVFRGLLGGVAGYVLAWAAAVPVARALVAAEARAARQRAAGAD